MMVLNDFKEPDSPIKFQQSNIKAVMDRRELGCGTLYITESLFSWQGPHGFSIPYTNIAMHALTKDRNLYPTECLLVMLDSQASLSGVENNQINDEDSDSDIDSEDGSTELIFVPEDRTMLPLMYEAIRQCQELHPDPEDISTDETDEDEAFEDMGDDVWPPNMNNGMQPQQHEDIAIQYIGSLNLNGIQNPNGYVLQQQQHLYEEINNDIDDEDDDDEFQDAD